MITMTSSPFMGICMPGEVIMVRDQTRFSYSQLTVDRLSEVNNRQKQAFQDGARKKGGQQYLEERLKAYLFRWNEALTFAKPGVNILDIGGGYISDEIFSLIIDRHKLNYNVIDIDHGAINEAIRKLLRAGKSSEQAKVADNSQIPFDSSHFDFIFSSHCLEHSTDLSATFSEIHRVLKPNGTLFMSVPFGFDEPDEHNYYLGIEEWSALVEAAGFRIVNVNLGRNYVDEGWDLSICATRARSFSASRVKLISDFYCKSGKTLIHHLDKAFVFDPPEVIRGHGACMRGVGSSCRIDVDGKLSALLVFRNTWAGSLCIEGKHAVQYVNAYSGVDWLSAVDVSQLTGPLLVTVVGGHPLAHDIQGGMFGLLTVAE
jgi:2-polyprenyl-3-methyl-5-hydroxy-6-metoxy-1,4-benzoquinol methylase